MHVMHVVYMDGDQAMTGGGQALLRSFDPAFVARHYKRENGHSYTLGAAPTVELLLRRPELVIKAYVRAGYAARGPTGDIPGLCARIGAPVEAGDKAFNRVGAKDSEHAMAAFRKPPMGLDEGACHVVLVNPADAGNLGTILRTGVGFGFRDFAIVCPGVDVFDPKAVRASMGAVFLCRHLCVGSFADYMRGRAGRAIYAFMLDGRQSLEQAARGAPPEWDGRVGGSVGGSGSERDSGRAYTLVFGNEAVGLPAEFHGYGMSVVIPHSPDIDSLNLPVAFGIAAHAFSTRGQHK